MTTAGLRVSNTICHMSAQVLARGPCVEMYVELGVVQMKALTSLALM
jgi:hypothetical protein